MEKYKLNNDADCNGTSLVGHIKVSPARVKEILGQGSESFDDYKSSAEWLFEGPNGTVFTLYDFKATSNYDEELPTPKDFWSQSKPVWLNIGGPFDDHYARVEFLEYLKTVLGAAVSETALGAYSYL